MKKFLSLVLALVMTMSLVTISAGAKDFTDNDKVNYDEAVQVISMLGIVNGYEDGSFKPANTLTRGAAAKIIANFKLTPAVADALKGSETTFKDVPATNVFSGYIAYCASEGIIAGYADGTFKPAGTLTANAFMKMLIGALGYDTTTYVGDNFATKVALKVKELGLAEGNTFVGSKALTREEACLYAFNALSQNGVYYEGGSSVTINGVNIVTGAVEKKYEDTYGKRVFGLKSEDAVDVFGRPATKYTAGKASVTVADTPVLSYKGAVSAKTLFADFQLGKTDEVTVNGTKINKGNSTSTDALFGTGANTATYIYATDTANVYDAYVISYEAGVVSQVNPANPKKETVRSIVVDSKTYETELFAKGDVVLYAVKDGAIVDVIAADSVEGSITAKKGGNYTIAGKAYATAITLAVGSKGTYYLSLDGTTVVYKDETVAATSSDLYAYVYNTHPIKNGVDENGFTIADATKVYFVKADGTKDTAILKSGDTVKEDSVYNYAITDGKFDVIEKVDAASTTALDKTRVLVVDKDNSYLATASTKYVFVNVDKENAKVTISTVTGYANAKVSAASIYAIADNNGRAVTVFVDGTPAGVEAAGLYAFLLDAVATETVENEKTVYTFDVFGGTVKTNSKTVADQIAALKAGARFSYKLTDGYVTEVTKVDANKTGEVKAVVEGDYFVVGTSALPFASDVVVYVNGDTFAAGTAADVVKGATVSVWTNSKDEASIIVVTPAAE